MFDFEEDGEEAVKRLAPTTATLRQLFALSGNICAFPNCGSPLIEPNGNYVGQLCHIEAAERGGQRFNEDMSNEERRAPSNLMLMCYKHHVETNDVVAYPPDVLQKMKTDHERLFSGVDRLILGEIRDWDKSSSLILPVNLNAYYDYSAWPDGHRPDLDFERRLIERLKMFAQAPLSVRAFVELVCKGIVRQTERFNGRRQFEFDINNLRVIDVKDGSRMSDKRISELIALMETYRLGGIVQGNHSAEHEIYINPVGDVPFFEELITFAQSSQTPTEVFFHDLDFSSLQAYEAHSKELNQSQKPEASF